VVGDPQRLGRLDLTVLNGRQLARACITSKMYCGNLLYPAVPWTEADAEAVTFTKNVDCAAIGARIAPAVTPPTMKQFKFFRTVFAFLS